MASGRREGQDAPLPFLDAFGGRTVLVTGHTGFKGSWLSLWLARLGADVVGYALAPPTTPNAFAAADVGQVLAGHHQADVRDAGTVASAVASAEPDVVMHLAAQPLVRLGYAQPHHTFDVNVMGTASVLDAVRRLGRPCAVVIVSSDKCYEDTGGSQGHRETDPLGGADPYSASKGATELVTAAYRRSFFPPEQVSRHGVLVGSARAGNVVGGGDWSADRIIPDAVRAIVDRRVLAVRHPDAVRPWQHVLEPLSGYLTLAARLLGGDVGSCAAWNFGPRPADEVKVRCVVERFHTHWGRGGWEDRSDPGAPPERPSLRLAIERATAGLGWRPRWGLDEALARTARWYRMFHEDRGERAGSMGDACLDDIASYERAGLPS